MTTQAATEPTASDESGRTRDLGHVIAVLSRHLSESGIGTGDLAELRRMDREELPPAFWRLYLDPQIVPTWCREPGGRVDVGVDLAWAALVRAMVEMAPRPHSSDPPFATALAASGYSEVRFVHLLRSENADLARELRTAGAWLARAGVGGVNWRQPAHFVLRHPRLPTLGEHAAHSMAKDYFREAARQVPSK